MDLLSSETARWLLAVWVLFLGGAVGSFLNVLVYRLPAGMSISWPGSHCPLCGHPIRAYDNVPVLAWLWLRGHCRDCHERISVRYPLVEAVTAGLFALLLVVEVYHGGQILPAGGSLEENGLPPFSQEQAICVCLFHLGLLCTLMVAGLIRRDDKQPPLRLYAPLLLAGMVLPPIWPWLHALPAVTSLANSPWRGAIDNLLGLAIALVLGGTAGWLGRHFAQSGHPRFQVVGEALIVGVVLGWQATVVIVPLAILLEGLSQLAAVLWPPAHRLRAAVWIMPLALIWILNGVRPVTWL